VSASPDSVRPVIDGARSMTTRETAAKLVGGFREHGLLIEAGAIAFRTLLALLTGALCLVGMLGFFELSEVWREEVAPDVRSAVSGPAFEVIDQAVVNVLQDQQVFWVTIGAVLAVWQASSVVRATGQVLNRIYSVEDDRSLKRELLTSVAVGAAVALLVVLALATVRLGPLAFTAVLGETTLVDILSFAVRWIVAIAALFLALGLIVRTAPARERPLHWITFGSLVVIGGWVAMTVLFGVYLTSIASFDSVFGGLASVFLLAEYLFLSAVFLLGGLLLDVVVEHRAG
jgi:membrane protein